MLLLEWLRNAVQPPGWRRTDHHDGHRPVEDGLPRKPLGRTDHVHLRDRKGKALS